MSSSVYLNFDDDIEIYLPHWLEFCEEHGISYSPQTAGGNTFYLGQVEITFGKMFGPEPPPRANDISFSTFFMGDLRSVADISLKAWEKFGGAIEAAPEIRSLIYHGYNNV